MSKLDVSQTLSIVANFGVIVGIGFLAYELRQNTAAIQADTFQSLVAGSAAFIEDLASDPELMTLIFNADSEELSQMDLARVSLIIRSRWIRQQGAYQHWRRGSLSTEDWQSYVNSICSIDTGRFFAEHRNWPQMRDTLLSDFIEYVEACRPDLAQL